jgi:universal stress protein E
MQRFKNILLVDEGGAERKAALERAITLAKRNQAALTVVGILEGLPPKLPQIQGLEPATLQEMAIQERREQLENLVAPLRREGMKLTSNVLIGTPFLAIIREVLRNHHDLVMLNAEGNKGLKEMIFSSTEMHLMRKCPCPVWVTKPTHLTPYARILAAVDPDPAEVEHTALNRKIMELATSLAHLEQSELHIVHAWDQYGESILRGAPVRLPKEDVDKIVAETQKNHEKWLHELLRKYPLENLKHQVHLLKGEPEQLIPELAREKQIEIIVMGTVCRTGVDGFLTGNTAERVLHQVDCSVLTLKPDGFVTPVKLD